MNSVKDDVFTIPWNNSIAGTAQEQLGNAAYMKVYYKIEAPVTRQMPMFDLIKESLFDEI